MVIPSVTVLLMHEFSSPGCRGCKGAILGTMYETRRGLPYDVHIPEDKVFRVCPVMLFKIQSTTIKSFYTVKMST